MEVYEYQIIDDQEKKTKDEKEGKGDITIKWTPKDEEKNKKK